MVYSGVTKVLVTSGIFWCDQEPCDTLGILLLQTTQVPDCKNNVDVKPLSSLFTNFTVKKVMSNTYIQTQTLSIYLSISQMVIIVEYVNN